MWICPFCRAQERERETPTITAAAAHAMPSGTLSGHFDEIQTSNLSSKAIFPSGEGQSHGIPSRPSPSPFSAAKPICSIAALPSIRSSRRKPLGRCRVLHRVSGLVHLLLSHPSSLLLEGRSRVQFPSHPIPSPFPSCFFIVAVVRPEMRRKRSSHEIHRYNLHSDGTSAVATH
jgi:hypothetical protein